MTDVHTPKYPMGKISRAFFETVISRNLGARRKDIEKGPANGVDVGVVRLPGGRAMISTTDPIYIVPPYGWERAAWFAFHILASDLTTSGVAPQYATMDWNLPMDIEDDAIEAMLKVMDREAKKYGTAIVTGKGLSGEETEAFFASDDLGLALIRSARKDEKVPRYFPNWLRQRVEAIIWTLKNQLGLDATAAASPPGYGPGSCSGCWPSTPASGTTG